MKKLIIAGLFLLNVGLYANNKEEIPKECENINGNINYYLAKAKEDKVFSERWVVVAQEYKNQLIKCVKKPMIYQQTRKRDSSELQP